MQKAVQKTALGVLAVILILGGTFMMIFAASVKENNVPREVRINCEVAGYLGENSETDSEMNALTGIGIIATGIGAVTLIASIKIKSDEETGY